MPSKKSLKPRNAYALAALERKAGAHRDKRKGRGGSKNMQLEYLAEYEEDLFYSMMDIIDYPEEYAEERWTQDADSSEEAEREEGTRR